MYIGRQIVNSRRETGNGECLTENLISQYLEGALTPVVKAACEVHLIACDRCREHLATVMRLLRADVDQEEEAELQRAAAQWERRNLQAVPARRPAAVWKRVSYAFVGVAAIFVMALLFRGFFFMGQPTAEDIVQALLEKNRPFDAQMSRQPYLELNRTRSSESGPQFGLLSEEMTKRAADAYRLGRFYLIEGNYNKAIDQLQTAAGDPNAPPEVHNDLGVGYLQRYGEGDFERARREFEIALNKNKGFPPAIFNLSILYERNGMSADAEQHWKRYLELDSDSGWAQEVRKKSSRKDSDK
jgi:tetratricopeptide (TPR) repeat protein